MPWVTQGATGVSTGDLVFLYSVVGPPLDLCGAAPL